MLLVPEQILPGFISNFTNVLNPRIVPFLSMFFYIHSFQLLLLLHYLKKPIGQIRAFVPVSTNYFVVYSSKHRVEPSLQRKTQISVVHQCCNMSMLYIMFPENLSRALRLFKMTPHDHITLFLMNSASSTRERRAHAGFVYVRTYVPSYFSRHLALQRCHPKLPAPAKAAMAHRPTGHFMIQEPQKMSIDNYELDKTLLIWLCNCKKLRRAVKSRQHQQRATDELMFAPCLLDIKHQLCHSKRKEDLASQASRAG